MSKIWYYISFVLLWMPLHLQLHAQIMIDTSRSPSEIVADVLLGKRVKVKNVRYIGSKLALAVFQDTSATPLIEEGILLSTGKVFDARGPNRRANTTYAIGSRGDRMLENISRGMTFDAASLEFDFTTELETVQFNFFFGSEEYTEYVNSEFNDVFGFFISGPGYGSPKNLAIVPKNKAPITVNTVNHIYNRSNYLDNNPFDRLGHLQRDKVPSLYPDLLRNYEYDGFTTLLTAEARVKPGAVYHIKITIADVSDSRYDSGVFLEASSFTSLPQDPQARAQILTDEYANAKRKFRPVTVGKNPGNPGETLPDISETVAEFPSKDWRFMVNFDFDQATLSSREKARLDSLWENVLSKSTKKVYVQGHTDDVGDEAYNDRLSDSRAQAVYDHLQSRGMQVQRIVKHGFGYHKPVTSNATDQGRALNRRVEIGVEQP